MKRKRQSKGPYVALPKAILDAPAWRAMSPWARLLWVDLRGWLRNDGLNNGSVRRSVRDASKSLGFNKDTIARGFAELDHYGFVRQTAAGFLGSDGRGIAAKYRFTDLAHGTHWPTREFEKWEGELYVEPSHRQRPKKQNPVRPRRTGPVGHTDPPAPPSVCPAPSDIGAPAECPAPSDISRLPFPRKGEGMIQDSSSRASEKSEGAGSNPVPGANTPDERGRSDGLMGYVAGVIRQQLDALDARRAPSC